MANVATVDIGDYRYTLYDGEHPYASVKVIDITKSSYGTIEDYIIYDSVTYDVTIANSCFDRCTALINAPTIPDSVTNMWSCFEGCTSLTTAPTIPNSVTNMRHCFDGCTSLVNAPILSNSVDDILGCFSGCTALTTAPVIPDSVTDVHGCFEGCTSLVNAPTIPDSVISVHSCFKGCTALVNAPVIPNSVRSVRYCFEDCTSLSGDVYILRDDVPLYYSDCFKNTTQPIILHTYNYESELIATANNNNVTAGAHGVGITILNTRALTDTENASYDVVGGIRVDMLIDCPQNVGYLIGCSPSYMTLYDMNDNIINFGFGIEHPTYIRCYGVLDNTNNDFPVIPSSSYLVDISVENVAPIYSSYSIELPSTAQSCKIIQDGETDLMSPRVNLQDIKFNPIGTNTNVYNVLDILRVIVGQNIPAYTGGMNSAQINKEDDIKHYVASADNIMVNETTTLQDYITNLYNSLS